MKNSETAQDVDNRVAILNPREGLVPKLVGALHTDFSLSKREAAVKDFLCPHFFIGRFHF